MNFKLDTINDRQKIYLSGIIIIVSSWLFYSFIFIPQCEQESALSSQYQTKSQQVRVIDTFVLDHPDTDRYLMELDARLNYVDKMIPNNSEIRDVLVQLELDAKAANVQVYHVKPLPVVNKNNYHEIPLEVNFRGNFYQVMDFLKRLEDDMRFTSVNKLAIQSNKQVLDCKINALVYGYGVAPNNSNNK